MVMKARTKFMRMFDKLPIPARGDLVLNAYGDNPMSLNVIYSEVKEDTKLGKLCLIELGYLEVDILTAQDNINLTKHGNNT